MIPGLLVDRAEAAGSAGWFDKAIADLDRVLKADPARVDALIYRASAYREAGRLAPALSDIEKALTLAPDSVPALLERGDIRRLGGDNDGARQDWLRVVQLAPGSAAEAAAKANIERLAIKGDRGTGKRRPAAPAERQRSCAHCAIGVRHFLRDAKRRTGMQIAMPSMPQSLTYAIVAAIGITALWLLVIRAIFGPGNIVAALLLLAFALGIYCLIARNTATIVTAREVAATTGILFGLCALGDLVHRLSLSGGAVPLGGGRSGLRVRAVAAGDEPGRAAARRRDGGRRTVPAHSSAHAGRAARCRDPQRRRICREAADDRGVTRPRA